MAELPNIGTPMYLVHREDTSYRSRLEAVDGGRFSVAAPLETTDPDVVRAGQTIEVFWALPRTRVILPCRLVQIADSAPYQWLLEPVGSPRKSNRREFVRGGGGPVVGLGTPPPPEPGTEPEPGTAARPAEGGLLSGRLLDISEGGLRCHLPGAAEIKVGDRVLASTRLSTGELEVEGAVHTVRAAFDEPGHHVILTFDSDEQTAQLIRQHVFTWEITERRRELDG